MGFRVRLALVWIPALPHSNTVISGMQSPSLSLNFPICKMRLYIATALQGSHEDERCVKTAVMESGTW